MDDLKHVHIKNSLVDEVKWLKSHKPTIATNTEDVYSKFLLVLN